MVSNFVDMLYRSWINQIFVSCCCRDLGCIGVSLVNVLPSFAIIRLLTNRELKFIRYWPVMMQYALLVHQ